MLESFGRDLTKLIGYEVQQVIEPPDDADYENRYYGLILRPALHNKQAHGRVRLWFLRDEEGNGPGAWDIEPEL